MNSLRLSTVILANRAVGRGRGIGLQKQLGVRDGPFEVVQGTLFLVLIRIIITSRISGRITSRISGARVGLVDPRSHLPPELHVVDQVLPP